MTRVAWFGLGPIGKAICGNLAQYGEYEGNLILWNRTHKYAVELAATLDAATVVSSISAAIEQSDMICICVADDNAVRQIVKLATESNRVAGKLFVDLSTIHPNTSAEVAKTLRDVGAEYLASPVFGGVHLALQRQVTLVLAGTAASIATFLPFTNGVICKNTITLSDQPCEQAGLLKLIGNYVRLSAIRSLCEGIALSEKVGLPPQVFADFTNGMSIAPTALQTQMLVNGEYHRQEKPTVPISMVVKENEYLRDVASSAGVGLPSLEELFEATEKLVDSRGLNASILAFYGLAREQCGLPFEN